MPDIALFLAASALLTIAPGPDIVYVLTRAVTQASGPIVKSGRFYPMFQITILGVTLIIDLAPDQPGLRDMRGAATLMGQSLYIFPTKRAA